MTPSCFSLEGTGFRCRAKDSSVTTVKPQLSWRAVSMILRVYWFGCFGLVWFGLVFETWFLCVALGVLELAL